MALVFDQPIGMARTSFYAAIKLASLVQKVKNCLKSRIKKYPISAKPSEIPHPTMLTPYARETLDR